MLELRVLLYGLHVESPLNEYLASFVLPGISAGTRLAFCLRLQSHQVQTESKLPLVDYMILVHRATPKCHCRQPNAQFGCQHTNSCMQQSPAVISINIAIVIMYSHTSQHPSDNMSNSTHCCCLGTTSASHSTARMFPFTHFISHML